MADKKISELNSAAAVYDADDFALVQDGDTKQVNASAVKAYVKDGLSKSDVGLGNVDNTSDANKPVSTATQTALDLKQDAASAATLTGTQTLTNKTISGSSNTLSNIGNSSLTNSSITINGNAVSLGGSTTVSAATTNTLTIGTGLSGTSFNGSAATTIAIDSSVVTLTGTQTLTNKTLTSPAISGGTANNVAIGGTTPAAGAFTTLSSTGNTTLGDASGDTLTINAGTTIFAQGTANGVLYLNGSKVATSGSGLTFDGTKLIASGGNEAIRIANTAPYYSFYNAAQSTLYGYIQHTGTDLALVNVQNGAMPFYVNNTETARITSKGLLVDYTSDSGLSGTGNAIFSGSVGIGTSSPGAGTKLNVAGRGLFTGGAADPNDSTASGVAINYDGTTGFVGAIQTGVAVRPLRVYGSSIVLANSPTATPTATFDASGNLGLGVTPSAWDSVSTWKTLQVRSAALSSTTTYVSLSYNAYENLGWKYIGAGAASVYTQNAGVHTWGTAAPGTAGNAISFTQAMTLDASGYLKLGGTDSFNRHTIYGITNNAYLVSFINNQSAPYGPHIKYSTAPNAASNEFLLCNDSSAVRLYINSNGGIGNYSANNVNLSDERVKTAITPAPSWLAKLNAIEVVNFKYKDQTHEDPNLGVIAQQVLSVAPELVDEDGFGETPEDGVPLMAIYETDLKYAMLKAIQELHAEIESLKAKVN